MPDALQKMREERARIVSQAREINDRALAENRNLSSEEQEQWDRMFGEVESLAERIERNERLRNLEAELETSAGRRTDPDQPGERRAPRGESLRAAVEKLNPRWTALADEMSGDIRGRYERLASEPYRRAFRSFVRSGAKGLARLEQAELLAIQADDDDQGGYLVAPMQFVAQLIKFVDNAVWLRQLSTVIPVTSAQSLGIPSLDTDPSDANWTAEILTGSEDTAMRFGKRELNPHPLAKRLKLSNKLLRNAAISAEDLVSQRLGYKFAVTEENAFFNGSGAQQPLGLFTASNLGISTGRDVSTGNTTTSITFDGLINALYALKPQYQAEAVFAFHRDGVKQIRALKDSQNQYLWQPATQAGEPDTILGRPVRQSEYIPNTFTTGLYVGIVGAFRNYWIAENLSFGLQRLEELYAETNQVGFIGRQEVDGMPVLEEAFTRVKLA